MVQLVSQIPSAKKCPVRVIPKECLVSLLEKDYFDLSNGKHFNFLELFGVDKKNPEVIIVNQDYAKLNWEGRVNGVFQEIAYDCEQRIYNLDGYYVALPCKKITIKYLQEAMQILEEAIGTRYNILFND